jgi:hypothetical protein
MSRPSFTVNRVLLNRVFRQHRGSRSPWYDRLECQFGLPRIPPPVGATTRDLGDWQSHLRIESGLGLDIHIDL